MSINYLVFFGQSIINEALDKKMKFGKDRNAEQHAHNTEKTSAKKDGKDDPEGGQANGISKDLWTQNIAVKLLENQYENDKNQALGGTVQHNEYRAGYGHPPKIRLHSLSS